jgi:hypothetical protein
LRHHAVDILLVDALLDFRKYLQQLPAVFRARIGRLSSPGRGRPARQRAQQQAYEMNGRFHINSFALRDYFTPVPHWLPPAWTATLAATLRPPVNSYNYCV